MLVRTMNAVECCCRRQHRHHVVLIDDTGEGEEPKSLDAGRTWIVVGYSGESDPVFDHLAG